jgi:hypothetical protein
VSSVCWSIQGTEQLAKWDKPTTTDQTQCGLKGWLIYKEDWRDKNKLQGKRNQGTGPAKHKLWRISKEVL